MLTRFLTTAKHYCPVSQISCTWLHLVAQQVWRWPADDAGSGGAEFFSAESFRDFVEAKLLDPELRAVLPQGFPGTWAVEQQAETALRHRMCGFCWLL